MELTKKILNISIAFGIVCLSLSALIYSARDSKAIAAPQNNGNNYEVAGIAQVMMDFAVIGYNRTTGDMKILARESVKEMKD
jgi:hypothetical protein